MTAQAQQIEIHIRKFDSSFAYEVFVGDYLMAVLFCPEAACELSSNLLGTPAGKAA